MTSMIAPKDGTFAFYALLFMSMMVSAQAQAFDAGGLSYNVTDAVANTVEVTGRAWVILIRSSSFLPVLRIGMEQLIAVTTIGTLRSRTTTSPA